MRLQSIPKRQVPGATFGGAAFISYDTLQGFVNMFQRMANGDSFITSFLREMGCSYGVLANGQLNTVRQWSTMSNAKKAFVFSSNIAASVAALASFAGTIIFVTAVLTGGTELLNVAILILNSTTVVAASLIIISNTYYIMPLRTASSLGSVAKMSSMMSVGPVNAITAVISGNEWSYAPAAGTEGFFNLRLRATDQAGNVAEKGIQWRGLVDNLPPTISALEGKHVWEGNIAKTEYTFLFADFALDVASVTHPCSAGQLTSQSYSVANNPKDGFTYSLGGTCTVLGHESSRSFAVCDLVNNCQNRMVTPAAAFNMTITAVNNSANLQWNEPHAGCTYNMHRSATPYFTADGANFVTVSPTNDYGTDDIGTNNGFYQMAAVSCTSAPDNQSNELGVFSFTFEPGTP